MITAEILLARESGPVIFTMSVKIAVEALPERGLIIATDRTSGGMPRTEKDPERICLAKSYAPDA